MSAPEKPGLPEGRPHPTEHDTAGLLDLLIEQVIDYAIFVLDPGGNIASWNKGAERIKGYTRDEIIGKPYAWFFTEDERLAGKPKEILAHAVREGRFQEEGWRVRKDGSRFWASVTVTALHDHAGELRGFAKITRDLTERRRVDDEARRAAEERAARQQAEKDEKSWAFLAEASLTLGSSLDYGVTLQQLANLAVARIADWCRVEILDSRGSLAPLAVAHRDPVKRELAQKWQHRWPPRPGSIPYRVAQTGIPELVPEITDEMVAAEASDPEQGRMARELGLRSALLVPLVVGQKPFGVVSFVMAESGRRFGPEDLILATEIARRASLAVENARAYADVRTAVEVRDNFLAIASHELRTPLSGLTVLMTSLGRAANQGRLSQLSPEALKDRITKAERQTRQLAQLVDRLLDVNRLSTRDLRLERERVDLGEVARDVISRYEDAAAQTGSRIDLKISGPAVGVWDRSRMDQVVTNLIGNAVKYGAGAPIAVSLSSGVSGYVRLSVRDGGPGIAIEDQERIFGQFERAASAENLPGMGLGLWLVRRLVTAHGGTVTLDSSPGHGATFTVVLPTRQETAPRRSESLTSG